MSKREIVVVGAGVAGLNAAMALVKAGEKVTLLERREFVGGRAYSYKHPSLEETVDSQHVLLGCCTNLLDFCHDAGLDGKIRWYDDQTFLEPGGRASTIALSSLPAPLHYSASFAKASMLTLADKAAIARGLLGFARGNHESDAGSIAAWYKRTGQTEGAIRHFWEPIVLATLNDTSENSSMKYGGKVFYELFLKTSYGGKLGIPTVPLSEFYGAGVARIEALGGSVELGTSIESLTQGPDGRWVIASATKTFVADDVILALPFEQTTKLVQGMKLEHGEDIRTRLLWTMSRFVHSPFISILLWYDREITTLDHAWLLDTTIQWFFHKSRIRQTGGGSYVELVIAGSKTELPMSRAEILEPALAELARFFPEAAKAKLLKSGILKEARATFSVTPGLDVVRPSQRTGLGGLYLAGDWTATDWPSTMESAARSGRLAAGEVMGDRNRFLLPEPGAEGLMRLLCR